MYADFIADLAGAIFITGIIYSAVNFGLRRFIFVDHQRYVLSFIITTIFSMGLSFMNIGQLNFIYLLGTLFWYVVSIFRYNARLKKSFEENQNVKGS